MAPKIRKTPDQLKRKYNAAFRLRKKLGTEKFPPYSRVIFEKAENTAEIPEARILLKEFGFIIKPELF